jgi:thiol:disulfide interchange protein DsbA
MSRWHGLFAAALACAALAASAQELTPGKDYGVVTPPQKTDDPSKVVVIEFFSYACPHCNALNPSLTLWENRLAKDVHFEREAVISAGSRGRSSRRSTMRCKSSVRRSN